MITSSGRSIRNVVEAVLFFAFFVLLFVFLPISFKVKVVLIVMTGGPAAFFGYVGIHKYPVTEYLYLVIKFKSKPHKFEWDDMFASELESENNTDFSHDDNNNN